MDLSTFIVSVSCLIDDRIEDRRLRARDLLPRLSDSEVLTIEIVGEFLGLDTDDAIFRYFRQHYGEWFPTLREVHRIGLDGMCLLVEVRIAPVQQL